MYELLKPMSRNSRLQQLLSVGAALVLVVGCGIAAQSPAAQTPAGSVPPRATATAQAQATAGGDETPGATAAEATPDASASEGAACNARRPAANQHRQRRLGELAGCTSTVRARRPATIPMLEKFTAATRESTVTYQEDINDNAEFFGRIQPDLAAGNSTGYDLITPRDWMVERLIRLGYLQPLDKSTAAQLRGQCESDILPRPVVRPRQRLFSAMAGWHRWHRLQPDADRSRNHDASTICSIPRSPARSGMFSEMIDTMSLTLLSTGKECPRTRPSRMSAGGQGQAAECAEAGQTFRASTATTTTTRSRTGDIAIDHGMVGRHQRR